ncbi:MAG: cysteine desulfurase IscS [Armatimonadota bacterium]|nr:MAG: cysteine desulfurase IscS [Armatimonadota bacterium]
MNTGVIYLDHHSSTPVDPRVVQAMMPFWTENTANPSNPYHPLGRRAADAVETAREQVAMLIGAKRTEIVFTCGATESNNIAILGTAMAHTGNRRQIVTCAIEHKSVLEPCRWLAERGYEVIILPVDSLGHVQLSALEQAVDENTLLVSIQLANNEIGTLQRMEVISRLVHERGALLHCDGAQAVGKIPVNVEHLYLDMLSISAHKLYGPKGAGALYVRGGARRARLQPLMFGGGQEWSLRPGTLNVPAIVGFGEACRICHEQMPEEATRVGKLRDRLEQLLKERIPSLQYNGDPSLRLPNNSSLTFPDVEADALLLNLPDVALSTGSACTAGAMEPSHVLQAIGLSREQSYRTIRVGLGRFNTEEEIERAAARIAEVYHRVGAIGER